MNIYIRADASVKMGTGHIMRCFTLADKLRENSAEVKFICLDLPGNMINFIQEKGYKVERLPYKDELSLPQDLCQEKDAEHTRTILLKEKGTVDWLIIDHYGIDKRWEKELRPFVKKIMVIDDLADRPHDCDILLNQNLYDNLETRYDSLVPSHCRKLLGPKYALIRQEFVEAQKELRDRDGSIRYILIFFGGTDPTNETAKALKAIQLLKRPDIIVDVVVGQSNPNKEMVKEICANMPNVHFHCQVTNMAELMARADLAIGAGGSATWERCFMGLPSVTITVASNQADVTDSVAKAGAIRNMGLHNSVTIARLIEELLKLINNPADNKEMSSKSIQIMGHLNNSDKDVLVRMIMGHAHVI